jgi:flagellar motor switch protein FliG
MKNSHMKSIKNIVKEEIQNMVSESVGEMMGIPEVAEMLSRVDPNLTLEDMQGMLQQEYQQGGDEAVRKFFYEATKGTDLQILGRGKYALKF